MHEPGDRSLEARDIYGSSQNICTTRGTRKLFKHFVILRSAQNCDMPSSDVGGKLPRDNFMRASLSCFVFVLKCTTLIIALLVRCVCTPVSFHSYSLCCLHVKNFFLCIACPVYNLRLLACQLARLEKSSVNLNNLQIDFTIRRAVPQKTDHSSPATGSFWFLEKLIKLTFCQLPPQTNCSS